MRLTHGVAHAARASILLCFALFSSAGAASADVQTIDGMSMPIVRVNVKAGNVTVRTWDRPSIQIDADPSLQISQRTVRQSDASYSLPIPSVAGQTLEGPVDLPAESFVASLAPGPYETIIVRDPPGIATDGPTPVTITIPSDSAFVLARTGNGTLDVRDYHGGTFVGFVGRGRMQLTNMGGTVFAQTNRGAMIVADSSFERVRARSLTGNIAFERCNVRQIEATSVNGSIVFDGGSFQPGLARFESARGDIAVGVTSPAELGGHADGSGHVYTNFQGPAHVDDRAGETSATVDGGGPVVTAITRSGDVFFYDGSLRGRPQLAQQWQAPLSALQRPGVTVRHERPVQNEPEIFRQRFPDYRQFGPKGTVPQRSSYEPSPPRRSVYQGGPFRPRPAIRRAANRPGPRAGRAAPYGRRR
jgi:hypothetical protein